MYLALLLIVLAKVSALKPHMSAGIYAAAKFLMLTMFGVGFVGSLISAGIGFVLAFAYFTILLRLDRNIFLWFFVTVFGALLVTMI